MRLATKFTPKLVDVFHAVADVGLVLPHAVEGKRFRYLFGQIGKVDFFTFQKPFRLTANGS